MLQAAGVVEYNRQLELHKLQIVPALDITAPALEIAALNPDIATLKPEIAALKPEIATLKPEIATHNFLPQSYTKCEMNFHL